VFFRTQLATKGKSMFEQSPMVGPGNASLTTHTLEILLLLVAAFVLGWLLRHWMDKSARIALKLEAEQKHRRQLENDFDRLRAEHSAMGSRISLLEGDLMAAKSDAAAKSMANSEAQTSASDLQARFDALRAQFDGYQREHSSLSAQNQSLSDQLKACGETQASLRSDIARLEALLDTHEKASASRASPVSNFIPTAPQQSLLDADPALALASDDLKIVEGIGPKIASILQAAGIVSFRQLAETKSERLREILVAAGERYRIHDPSTWPEQASLCAAGAWDELKALQDRLTAGRN
jgi:predicted flap endonuclease-1-like 5' DNA nuclease/cell division protein FtsL